jgi:hypothetical protein
MMRTVLIFAAASMVAGAGNGFASAQESLATVAIFLGSCLAVAGLLRPAIELWDRFVTRPRREAQDRATNAMASMESRMTLALASVEARYETLRRETKQDIDLVQRRIDQLPKEIAQILRAPHETDPTRKS